MIDWLNQLDRVLFVFINSTLANPLTDAVMPLLTSDDLLRVIYGLALALCLWKGDARLRWLVLFSAITLVLTDQLAANFLKDIIGRLRPCHPDSAIPSVHLLVGCGGGKSMPSAHAANSFGQAVLFGLAYRHIRTYILTFAGLITISRVFVGAHYPGDIIVGAVVGGTLGWLVLLGYRAFIRKFLTANLPEVKPEQSE
jgi:undecaprenyl-diphosphatase